MLSTLAQVAYMTRGYSICLQKYIDTGDQKYLDMAMDWYAERLNILEWHKHYTEHKLTDQEYALLTLY